MGWIRNILTKQSARQLSFARQVGLVEFDATAALLEASLLARAEEMYGSDPLHRDGIDAFMAPFQQAVAEERAKLTGKLHAAD
jgi:hypothetical protein